MSKPVTVVFTKHTGFRRFETLRHPGGVVSTIVKIIKTADETTYVLKVVKWSKYKFINKLIRIWLTIKYI